MPFNRRIASEAAAKTVGVDFVKKVAASSVLARNYGQSAACAYYARVMSATKPEAEAFYDAVKGALADNKIVLNMSGVALSEFLAAGRFSPDHSRSDEDRKFNNHSHKRSQAEKAMGCNGLSPVYASLTKGTEGDRQYGDCSVVLSGLGGEAVLVSGDTARLRNPSSPDYVPDASLVLYSMDDAADCRAAAAILALPESVLLAGPLAALDAIGSAGNEYGVCEAMLFGDVSASAISQITVESEASACGFRTRLASMGKLCPVVVSSRPITIYGRSADPEGAPPRLSVPQKHFSMGDRVAMKPTASNPAVLGTIMDVSNGLVSVQWDDSQRAVYDMTEALMRVMSAPEPAKRVDGMVSYSLPGMDDATVIALSLLGIDPVTLYSMASHAKPASPEAGWWQEPLLKSLAGMGINAYVAKGFAKNSGPDTLAFVPHKWLEARLPGGARLVMDVGDSGITIRAGDPEDYILPSPDAKIVFE